MVKKILCLLICTTLAFGMLAGCGASKSSDQNAVQVTTNPEPTTKPEPTQAAEPITIKILQSQPEYTDAYNAYIAEYKKIAPNITIDLEILQTDYNTVLKTRIASGSVPDIFSITNGAGLKEYAEYAADITNEPLANAMLDGVKQNCTYNGKLLTVPFVMDVFPLIYNKKLFTDAGISEMPKTLGQLEDVCKKLQAKDIVAFSNGYKEWWVQKHIFQHFINAESDNPEKLVQDFIDGNAKFKDHPTLMNYFAFVDMTVKYGLPKPLESDFNAEVGNFANAKAAIITGQGQWIGDGVTKINPDFDFGVMLYPVNDDPVKANVAAGASIGMLANKDSKVLQEALKLLNWRYTSDYGKNWFANVAKVIGPVKDIPAPDMKIPQLFSELTKQTPASGSPIMYSLDGFHQKFGEIMQKYIAKGATKEQTIDEIEKAWVKLGAAK